MASAGELSPGGLKRSLPGGGGLPDCRGVGRTSEDWPGARVCAFVCMCTCVRVRVSVRACERARVHACERVCVRMHVHAPPAPSQGRGVTHLGAQDSAPGWVFPHGGAPWAALAEVGRS